MGIFWEKKILMFPFIWNKKKKKKSLLRNLILTLQNLFTFSLKYV